MTTHIILDGHEYELSEEVQSPENTALDVMLGKTQQRLVKGEL